MYFNVSDGTHITGEKFCDLLALPRLERLAVDSLSNLHSADMLLPEKSTLTELELKYNRDKLDVSSFCEALKKMPKLRNLRIKGNIEETLELVWQVMIVAVSQNKDVILEQLWNRENSQKWKITRKNSASSDMKTLNIALSTAFEPMFFENVKTFVRNNLESHQVVVL